MADTLALPLHHVVGEGEERRRPLPEHAEPLLGSVDQHLRLPPRGLAAVDSRIGRLLLALVAPGGLAQLLEAPFDVEEIIHDLEGEPEIAARLGDRRHGLRVAAREARAHAERRADEGGGLVAGGGLGRLGRGPLGPPPALHAPAPPPPRRARGAPGLRPPAPAHTPRPPPGA